MWGLLTFVVGALYGYFSPGKSDKSHMFVRGLWIGLVLAIVLGLFAFFFGTNPLGLGGGFFGIFIAVAVLTVVFVLGVWLGDAMEGWTRDRRGREAVRGRND